jgi:hypothetical protein
MTYINHTVPIELRMLSELDSRAITQGTTLNVLIGQILRKDMDEYRAGNVVVLTKQDGVMKSVDGATWIKSREPQ